MPESLLTRARSAALVLTTAAVVAGAAVTTAASPASAAGALSPVSDRTSQTNGRVSALVTAGGRTFLGGSFSAVRNPGAASGSSRANLAAVDSATGALLSWRAQANGAVEALAASPDGRTLYAGGTFTAVNGVPRRHVVALDAHTGAVQPFRADTSGSVQALVASGDRVYLGGSFTSVDGQPRNRLAAVSASGALVPDWRPSADRVVRALALAPDGRHLYAGGDFTAVNGNRAKGRLVKLTRATGVAQPWASTPAYPVWDIVATGDRVYVGGNGRGGNAGAYSPSGDRKWQRQTDGGIQAIALLNGVLYVGGHFDTVCGSTTGGPPTNFECASTIAKRKKLMAVRADTGGLQAWAPEVNTPLGVFALEASGGRLRVGGTFTVLGGRPQQGYGTFR